MSIGIHQIIDQQIQKWELEMAAGRRVLATKPPAPPQIRPCITIARMIGAGGEEIARNLGQRLDYHVFDQEILEVQEKEGHLRGRALAALDEKDRSSLELWVEGLLHGSVVTKDDYLRTLIHALGSIAALGCAIVLGRGANFVLGPERALNVRIVAGIERRILAVSARTGLPRPQAEHLIQTTDHERAAFIHRGFHGQIDDGSAYDLVVNTDSLSLDRAADIIELAFRAKFESRPEVCF